ncbi:hypothetical protein ACOME3_007412 [Neoechinorhynchus agilis]
MTDPSNSTKPEEPTKPEEGTVLTPEEEPHIDSPQEEKRKELAEVQAEIQTLRKVLLEKAKKEQQLKSDLGIGVLEDVRHDIDEAVKELRKTEAFVKTQQSLKMAAERVHPQLRGLTESVRKSMDNIKKSPIVSSVESSALSALKAMKNKFPMGGNSSPAQSDDKPGSQ